MPSFYFRELQLITVLLLIRDSYLTWSMRGVSLEVCVELSISDLFSFLLMFVFLFNKKYGYFNFKTS